MHSVLSGGPAFWREHELLFINSRGFAQETFHTFSQSPVPGDDGKVGGVLLTVQETTEQVQGERQLRDAPRARRANGRRRDRDGGVRRRLPRFSKAPTRTFPSRSSTSSGTTARRRSLRRARRPSPRARVDLRAPNERGWPFQEVLRSGRARSRRRPRRAASVICREAATASRPRGPSSFRCSRDERDRYGFVVFGLAAWRAPSEGYLTFLGLVASQLASAIARARAVGGGATPRRGHGGARPRQDAVLQQHQPRASHAADADARPHDGRAPLARADASRATTSRSFTATRSGCRSSSGSLLDFARIEAGRARASLEAVRLDALTGELAQRVRRRRCARPASRTRSAASRCRSRS